MYRLRIAAVLLLAMAACAPKPPAPQGLFRKAGTQVYSIAAFDPARLPGRWDEMAAFASPGLGCPPGRIDIARGAAGLQLSGRLCRAGASVVQSGTLRSTGPGRLALTGEAEPWWIIWVDTDYRTLVIGTPSGRFGYIMNRGGALPPDRMKAARDILDWNGYDLSQLRVLR